MLICYFTMLSTSDKGVVKRVVDFTTSFVMGLKAFLSNVHNSYVMDFKVEKHIKTWLHKNSLI